VLRYSAFISYSHADTAVVRWLHHALETFRVPKALVGRETPLGPAPRRLAPIFRDRDELPASGDLGTELRAALADSAFLIVVCSPNSAKSHWVNEEILAFKRLHGDGRVLALIASGEPYSGENGCFPPALRFKMGPGGVLTTEPSEPIAADARPGKDGRRLASLKLIAGLTGLKLDQLVQREAARRQRRLAYIASGAVAVAAVTLLLAFYAIRQRDEARAQRELADSSLDFLINTFAIANPATENPRTITAITILDRVSKRAGGSELKAKPEVRARLLGATGDIYANLGLGKEAERDLTAALVLTPPRGNARAAILLKLAGVAFKREDLAQMRALLGSAERAYDPRGPEAALLSARLAALRGLAAYSAMDYRAAGTRFEAAAILFGRAQGDHSEDIGRALMNEGNALVSVRRYGEADKAFRQAEDIFVKAFGTGHLLTGTALQNRAAGAFEAGRLAEAEALLRRALAIYARVLDHEHPTTGAALLLEGRIRHAQQDYAGADMAFDAAITMFTRLYGAGIAAIGDTAFYKAEAQSDAGRPDLALITLAITQQAYDRTFGATDPEQVELANTRAQILRAAGRIEDARLACNHGLFVQAKLNPRDPALPAARQRCTALAADPPRVSLRFQTRH
jgi:tetratricopeptide (TPR) repeat protein